MLLGVALVDVRSLRTTPTKSTGGGIQHHSVFIKSFTSVRWQSLESFPSLASTFAFCRWTSSKTFLDTSTVSSRKPRPPFRFEINMGDRVVARILSVVLWLILIIGLCYSQEVANTIENPTEESKGIPAVDSEFLFLTINKSSLPFERIGLGVYSKIPIFKYEIICEYRGAIVPSNVPFESDYIYSTRTTTGEMMHIIPDMDKPICAYINDCVKILGSNYTAQELNQMEQGQGELPTYDGFHHNAGPLSTKMGKVFIIATEDIPARTEIFYPYGFGYWVVRLRNPAMFKLPLDPPK